MPSCILGLNEILRGSSRQLPSFIRCKYVRRTGARNIVNPSEGVKIYFVLHNRVESFYVCDRKMTRAMQHSARFRRCLQETIFRNATTRRDVSVATFSKAKECICDSELRNRLQAMRSPAKNIEIKKYIYIILHNFIS